jgi:membrane-bound ClpP family serine protease
VVDPATRWRDGLELAGWLLFLLGCILFLIQAVRAADVLNAAGSACFVIGVVAFLLARRLTSERA